jgi:hypothetical protein
VKDGERDFSQYTAEQIERSLRNVDREKYPLNYANLLAAQQALPPPLEQAEIDALRETALVQLMANGEVWLSTGWTVLLNTVLPVTFCLPLLWLLGSFLMVGFVAGSSIPGHAVVIAVVVFLSLMAWTMSRLRRVVVRNGHLEVRSHFRREKIGLQDIAIIRWNDTPNINEVRAALIELRVDNALGRKIRFVPRSIEYMRAFAAHVATVQGRAVADRAYKSLFYVGAAEP